MATKKQQPKTEQINPVVSETVAPETTQLPKAEIPAATASDKTIQKIARIEQVLADEQKTVKQDPPKVLPEDTPADPKERIVWFLSRQPGWARMNEFLKSLFTRPTFNQSPALAARENHRYIKGLLTELVAEGKVKIQDNAHKRLLKPNMRKHPYTHYTLDNMVLYGRI